MRIIRKVIGASLSGAASPAWIAAVAAFSLLSSADATGEASEGRPRLEIEHIGDVAGTSPYVGLTCNDFTADWMEGGGREGEPMIAVNPRFPENRIAVWMDRTRASIDTASTWDGGRHWTKSLPAHVDECTGNFDQQWEATGDPWVTFGPDGTAYFSFLSWAHFETPPLTSYVSVVHVVSSVDGGTTWSYPVGVGRQDFTADKDMIVADPKTPGTVYAGWRNAGFGLPVGARGENELLFSKTTDYAHTWSTPTVVSDLGSNGFFGNPQIVVLDDAALVYTTTIPTPSGATELVAFRSTDGGTTWAGPIAIATQTSGFAPNVCGHPFTGGYGQTSAFGQTIVHVEIDPATQALGQGEIILYWSKDGGKTWRNKPIIETPVLITLASVSIDRHHRLAVVWDEIDQTTAQCSAQPTAIVPTTAKLSVTENWTHWRTIDLGAKVFNLASALVPPNYNLGDYQALAPTRDGFAIVTVQGTPLVNRAPQITGNTGVIVTDVEVDSRDSGND